MQIYNHSFLKKDGTVRAMSFARLPELTAQDRNALGVPQPTGSEPVRKYAPGQELVWDVEAKEFKVFNWNTKID